MPGNLRPQIRLASGADLEGVTRMCVALWPDGSAEEHTEHAAAIFSGEPPSTLPLVIFVAELEGKLAGFIEVGLRSHADGCDTRHPVGFIEGWFVEPEVQRRGLGRALVGVAEEWAREQGAREMASDTWIDQEDSQRAHQALGYAIVDRCVHFRKSLKAGS